MPSLQSGSSVARRATRTRTHDALLPVARIAFFRIQSWVPNELQPSVPLDKRELASDSMRP